ncbi:DUF4349 domain-containing protein [Subtercola endophyticus]|uniref:DUF4349 domain-containing protein n=1 Tax=Subtercola endophyticus TaxID=2895559 RepID=UPI001E36F4FA|nr:DUF4349 domain-containing protein [Subtercola endophyticus]UFS57572.1 DUF4349 domain-containing protein [Subtercola endophyticus]
MKRKNLVIIGVAAVLMLTGCSAGSSSNSSSSSEGSGAVGSAQAPAGVANGGAADAAGAGSAAADALLPDTQVVTTGSLALTADDPSAVADQAVALTEAAGGHVDNRTQQSASDRNDARADLVLRVPSAKVSSTIDSLKKLATVESVSISATDVTSQVQDVDARITALQTSVSRLLDLMSKATNTTDLIALESTLSSRQADLDSLVAQKAAITDQVQYSSLTVGISSTQAAATVAPSDFWSGLGIGWTSVVAALSGALVALGVALPWLVIVAVIALIVIVIARFAGRKARHENPSTGA